MTFLFFFFFWLNNDFVIGKTERMSDYFALNSLNSIRKCDYGFLTEPKVEFFPFIFRLEEWEERIRTEPRNRRDSPAQNRNDANAGENTNTHVCAVYCIDLWKQIDDN